jgi:hypothetical protein
MKLLTIKRIPPSLIFFLLLTTSVVGLGTREALAAPADGQATNTSDSLHFGFPALILRIQELKASRTSTDSQRLSATNDLLLRILEVSTEIRVLTNRIDREVADADQRRAVLAERRDRAVRINTYADLVSGGITGLIGGGVSLGGVNHIAPDVIDTVEGGVQTGLSAWALQQQRGEQRIERTQPGLLAAIMDPTKRDVHEYPDDVWMFLNEKGPAGFSLRELLANKWTKFGFCMRHSGHRTPPRDRMIHMAMLHPTSNRVTIDLLEDRIAMLYDLRATVTRLEDELLQALVAVRAGG